MNLFKTKTTWSNAEFIPLKLCIASAYALIGSYFHSYVEKYITSLLLLFSVSLCITLYLWIKKMKTSRR